MYLKKLFILISFLVPGTCLLAQQTNQNRKPVFVDINSGYSFADNTFTNNWQPSPSLDVNIRLPFYVGQIEGGVRYTHFNGSFANSDFNSYFIHLGYSYPLRITSFFRFSPAIRFGDNLMHFDQPKLYTKGTFRYTTDPVESEFAYEFALRNQFKISQRLYFNATVSYNRTLTKFPLPQAFLSGGISYAFSEPQWIKNFLK